MLQDAQQDAMEIGWMIEVLVDLLNTVLRTECCLEYRMLSVVLLCTDSDADCITIYIQRVVI